MRLLLGEGHRPPLLQELPNQTCMATLEDTRHVC